MFLWARSVNSLSFHVFLSGLEASKAPNTSMFIELFRVFVGSKSEFLEFARAFEWSEGL